MGPARYCPSSPSQPLVCSTSSPSDPPPASCPVPHLLPGHCHGLGLCSLCSALSLVHAHLPVEPSFLQTLTPGALLIPYYMELPQSLPVAPQRWSLVGLAHCLQLLCDHFWGPSIPRKTEGSRSQLSPFPRALSQHPVPCLVHSGAKLMAAQQMDPTKEVSSSFHSFLMPFSSEG